MALPDVGGNSCYEVWLKSFYMRLGNKQFHFSSARLWGWCELSHLHDLDSTLVDPLQVKNGKGYRYGSIQGNLHLQPTAMQKLRQGKSIEHVAGRLGTSSLTSDFRPTV